MTNDAHLFNLTDGFRILQYTAPHSRAKNYSGECREIRYIDQWKDIFSKFFGVIDHADMY